MCVQENIINAVIELCESNVTLYSKIKIGALPVKNGIAMQLGAGSPDGTFFTKSTVNSMSVAVNSKHKEQVQALRVLGEIHKYLTRLKSYPSGEDWQIVDISTVAAPNLIGQESDQQYLYGSIIKIKFYYKGV